MTPTPTTGNDRPEFPVKWSTSRYSRGGEGQKKEAFSLAALSVSVSEARGKT